MKNRHWTERLIAAGACQNAVKWARGYRTFRAAWLACQRADWLLWWAGQAARTTVERRRVMRAACDCARLSLQYVPQGEERPLQAIEAAETWAKPSTRAASAAHSAAASTARDAAYAAAYDAEAAASAASVAAAASAASVAAAAAFGGVAFAYVAAAHGQAAALSCRPFSLHATDDAHAKMCGLVRRRLGVMKGNIVP